MTAQQQKAAVALPSVEEALDHMADVWAWAIQTVGPEAILRARDELAAEDAARQAQAGRSQRQ